MDTLKKKTNYKPKKENVDKLIVYLKKINGKGKNIGTNSKGK